MGADTGLLQMYSDVVKSRAGAMVPDLSPLYESNVKQVRQSLNMITGVINKLKKDENELKVVKDQQAQGLKKTIADRWTRLYEQK